MNSTTLPLIFYWPGQEGLGSEILSRLGWEKGGFELRHFPDGESYVRILSSVTGRRVVILASLDRPDSKVAPLLWFAETAKEMGAAKVSLLAPYLGYLRQDKRFLEGEAISSRYFAKLISASFDDLITVDPHLHRYVSLGEIYSIPSQVLSAASEIANWVRKEVERPLFIGPDAESGQWVSKVAALAGAPYLVAEKIRSGDRSVEIRLPSLEASGAGTPVLVDDIISTARTMIETVILLKNGGWAPPVCIGVHGIFAGEAYSELLASGAERVVTCNSLAHASNQIDLSDLLAKALEGKI